MILTYFYTILELSIKSLKEGTRIPNLARTRDKSKIGHEKNITRLNKVPNKILDLNLGLNEFEH
jgi:hypothetical protein